MNRRTYMRTMALGASALGFSGLLGSGCGSRDRPNVLLIVADDVNDWVGCLGGHPGVKTPNLDSLAGEGVLFQRAYCNAPLCNPSRTSLLTGLHPSTTGVYGNQHRRPRDIETMPSCFKRHGYRTIGAGKVFHVREKDEWDMALEPEGGNPRPAVRPVNGIPDARHFDWAPLDATDDDMRESRIADRVVEQLQKDHTQPFFLAWGIGVNHLPYYAPKRYFDMNPLKDVILPEVREDDLDDVPPIGRLMADTEGNFWWSVRGGDHRAIQKHGQWKRAVQGYLACLSFCDALVGRVLDALASSPYRDNTMVVFLSDQGTHLGEKNHWRKHTLWEESLHVPLIFAGAGITKRADCPRTVGLVDILPTMANLCALPVDERWEGKSLRPLLKDPSRGWNRPAVSTYGRNNHSVRSERLRYIRYEDGTEELYDHDKDPMEWMNLADYSATAVIKEEIASWLPERNAEDAPALPGNRKMRSQSKWEYLG